MASPGQNSLSPADDVWQALSGLNSLPNPRITSLIKVIESAYFLGRFRLTCAKVTPFPQH